MNILKMSSSEKDNIIAKEVIIALRKLGGSAEKRLLIEYLRINSEVISEEFIDIRKVSKKSGKEYSPFIFFLNFNLNYLIRSGYLCKSGKSYNLTVKGREDNIDIIDFSALYKEINKELKNIRNNKKEDDGSFQVNVDAEEEIENTWREELLIKLKKFSPAKFEMFARKLVSKMNVEIDQKKGVQVSNDGGLDGYGYITSDDFRTARVVIQAKRWEGNVPSPEIDKFRGVMDKYNAEFGIFITTSNFSKAAIEASRIGSRAITLINGEDIADLVAKYELYVKPVTTYVLDDFYDNE